MLQSEQNGQEISLKEVDITLPQVNLLNSNLFIPKGAQTDVKDYTVKGKVDLGLNLEVAAKKKFNDQLTITAAAKLALADPSKSLDFTKFTPFPLGFQVEWIL